MITQNLNQLVIYKLLIKRASDGDSVATVLSGLVVSLSGDAEELLGFIRVNYPSYTGHDLQHSWRILKRIEAILSTDAWNSFSTVELFSLIIASAFHDVGMIKPEMDQNELRRVHHIESEEFLKEYLNNRLVSISEYAPRLIKCIGFIAKAHNLSWEDMSSSEYFIRTELVMEQPLRTKILAIMLRVGDLLDMDADRTCDPLKKHLGYYFNNEESLPHHKRHKHVSHFSLTPQRIEIDVDAYSKHEHSIWSEWLGYLKQDILHANTYIFKGELGMFQLPELVFNIKKAKGATYELWPLRFEIDEKGRIWDVISQSVYTGRFDFLRELIQNGIDAGLRWIYLNEKGVVIGSNPKHWYLDGYEPSVMVSYSRKERIIEVSDNGIGMGKESLTKFLFNVASSGYKLPANHRSLPFPSIASFGIGFVSCLVRADSIIIRTKSREDKAEPGREVVLKTEAMDAFSEIVDCDEGTKVRLHLKKDYSYTDIESYIQKSFYSPAVPIIVFNIDEIESLISQINLRKGRELKFNKTENYSAKELKITFNEIYEKISEFNYADNQNESLERSGENPIAWKSFNSIINATKDVHDSYLKEPLFVFVDKLFEVQGVGNSFKHNNKKYQTAILYVPVKFFDINDGIEWYSVHALIIHNGIHKKNLIRYTGPANKWQDEEEIIIKSRDEWEEEWEDEYGNSLEDELDEDSKYLGLELQHGETDEYSFANFMADITYRDSKEGFKKMQYNEEDRLKLSEKINGIMISDILDREPKPYTLLDNQKVVTKGKNPQKLKNVEPSVSDNIMANLDSVLAELKGDVFQDGIRLPLKCWAIAPVGATFGRANFFGNSRFDLNVTRNSINESPTLLTNWTTNIARKIQKKVLNEVISTLESNNIEYKAERLITEHNRENTDSLYNYSIEVLESIIKAIK